MNIRRVIEIRYAQIRSLDLSNGEGVGVALFVQGCHFHCPNCFNPEAWDFNGGKEWTEEVKEKFLELVDRPYIKRVSLLGGECLAEENIDDVLDLVIEINKRYNTPQDKVYVTDKNNNILTSFPNKIRLLSPNKSIWLYTGYRWEKLFNDEAYTSKEHAGFKRISLIEQCDILIDGQYIDSQRDISLHYRGSNNQRVIDVQKTFYDFKGMVTLYENID